MTAIDWKVWWNTYALRTGGLPPRARDSADTDVRPAALDVLELLLPQGEDGRNCQTPFPGRPMRVLDIGSGPGRLALAVKKMLEDVTGSQVNFILSDIAPGFLEAGPWNIPSAALDSAAIPFRAETFDAVTAYSSLQYFETSASLQEALNEIHRVLIPGGSMAVCAYPDSVHREKIVEGYKNLDMNPGEKAERARITAGQLWLSREQFAEMTKKAGFIETSVSDMNPALWESCYMFNLRSVKPSC